MIIKSAGDLIHKINKDLVLNNWIGDTKLEKLIRLYEIIRRNLNHSDYIITFYDWVFPRYYLCVENYRNDHSKKVRLMMSYDIITGGLLDEVINGKKPIYAHGFVREDCEYLISIIKKELQTEFNIKIISEESNTKLLINRTVRC
jgi:hypothetical protein